MIATRIGKTERYVPRCDRGLPESEQTTFMLKVLSGKARMKVFDHLVGVDENNQQELAEPGTGLYAACQYGIERVEGLRDDAGEEIAVKRVRFGNHMIVTDEGLDLIADVIPEVGARIMVLNRIEEDTDEDHAGNPSTSSPTLPPGEQRTTTTASSEAAEPAQPATVSQ